MAYKATALVTDMQAGTDADTYQVVIRSTKPANPLGSTANIYVDNIDMTVTDALLQTAVIAAVKSYWGLGLLDGVRVL